MSFTPVVSAMDNPAPNKCKTITLTCGKLLTGVTIKFGRAFLF